MRNISILTVTGCYGTGSSAVTDFVKEFDGVSCKGDYEVRFIHDPDGISDLEFSLIENPNRHNSSNSLKKFKSMVEDLDHIYFIKRYSKQLCSEFLKYAYEYIDDLTIRKYSGAWHQDIYNKGKLFYIASRTSSHLSWFLNKLFRIPTTQKRGLLSDKEKAYLTIMDEVKFLKATRKFIDQIGHAIDPMNNGVVFFDQLVPPSNLKRYIRYFNDIKIILVERDPRDIYILEKYFWKGKAVPYQSIDAFCDWYIWTRNLYCKEDLPREVKFIQFEDFVYNYEKISIEIINHFKLNENRHIRKRQYFDPEQSKKNTHLWIDYRNEIQNIDVIERKLFRYCCIFRMNRSLFTDK